MNEITTTFDLLLARWSPEALACIHRLIAGRLRQCPPDDDFLRSARAQEFQLPHMEDAGRTFFDIFIATATATTDSRLTVPWRRFLLLAALIMVEHVRELFLGDTDLARTCFQATIPSQEHARHVLDMLTRRLGAVFETTDPAALEATVAFFVDQAYVLNRTGVLVEHPDSLLLTALADAKAERTTQ